MTPKDSESGPPLITSRSPSYERAREERRHPSPTSDPELVALIARLAEAEENAREAFATAAGQVRDTALAERLATTERTHADRVAAIGAVLSSLGAAPPRAGEARAVLDHGAADVRRAGSDAEVEQVLARVSSELAGEHDRARRDPRLGAAVSEALAR